MIHMCVYMFMHVCVCACVCSVGYLYRWFLCVCRYMCMFMCVCVCMLMCACTDVYTCVKTPVEARDQHQMSSPISTLVLRQGLLLKPELTVGSTGWPGTLKIHLAPLAPVLGWQMLVSTPGLLHGCEGWKLRSLWLHDWHFANWPFPQPQWMIL